MFRAKLSVVPGRAGALRGRLARGRLLVDQRRRDRELEPQRSTPRPRKKSAPAPTTRRSRCSRSSKAAPPARRWRSRRSSSRPTPSTRPARRPQALATLDRFIKLHPASPALDYALYLQGPDQLQRQPRHVSRHRAPGPVRARPAGRQASPIESFKRAGRPASRSRAIRRDARAAHELHRQLAGRSTKCTWRATTTAAAPTWPPSTARSRRWPTTSDVPALEEALYIMVAELRRARPDAAARRRRPRAEHELSRTATT